MRSRRLAVVLTAALALVACDSGGDDPASDSDAPGTGGPGQSAPAAPELEAFDPPKSFDPARATPLPGLDVEANLAGDVVTTRQILAGTTLIGVNDDATVVAYDLATGEQTWSVPMPGAPNSDSSSVFVGDGGPAAPVVSEDGTTAYTAVGTTIEGSGTTKDAVAAAVAAFDVETGELRWDSQLPLTHVESSATANPAKLGLRIVRTGGGRMLLDVQGKQTLAVDETSGEELWQAPWQVSPIGPERGIADEDTYKRGPIKLVDLTNGKAGAALVEEGSGPKVLGFTEQATAIQFTDGDGELTWYHVDSSGKIVKRFPDAAKLECAEAPRGETITLCGSHTSQLAAVDLTTMEELWEIGARDSDRVAPRGPVTFHGMLYGSVDGTGVVLDLTSGEDVTADAGADPYLVNEYGGVAVDDGDAVFYPAAS